MYICIYIMHIYLSIYLSIVSGIPVVFPYIFLAFTTNSGLATRRTSLCDVHIADVL